MTFRENKVIKYEIVEDVKALYETDKENYYEPFKTKGALNDN